MLILIIMFILHIELKVAADPNVMMLHALRNLSNEKRYLSPIIIQQIISISYMHVYMHEWTYVCRYISLQIVVTVADRISVMCNNFSSFRKEGFPPFLEYILVHKDYGSGTDSDLRGRVYSHLTELFWVRINFLYSNYYIQLCVL